jgi:lipoprotein-anchoring transpeptidase ErfK/SrfK
MRHRLVPLLLVAALVGGCSAAAPRIQLTMGVTPDVSAGGAPLLATTTTTTPPGEPAFTLVAATNGAVPGYAAPGQASDRTIPAFWYGYPTILPVIAQRPGWLELRLAQRPNESTTWVESNEVRLSTTPYYMVVDLTHEDLIVYKNGYRYLAFPAGIGAPDDPTPPGHYFITMLAPPPSPGYGPVVLVTSDHSDAITDWEGMGDAIIAVHGPIDSEADAEIGATGAAISHGCVRLHDSDLAQLEMIPPGTPFDVVS